MKEIILTFEEDGSVHKEVNGYKSDTCLKDTDFIDKAIGKVEETKLKPEYHLPNPVGLDQQQKLYR